MRLMLAFFRAYPWHTVIMLLALLFAGIAEGVGASPSKMMSVRVQLPRNSLPASMSRWLST